MFKSSIKTVQNSWNSFKDFTGYTPVKMQEINRTESIKSTGGSTTYNRYDEKYGLHNVKK